MSWSTGEASSSAICLLESGLSTSVDLAESKDQRGEQRAPGCAHDSARFHNGERVSTGHVSRLDTPVHPCAVRHTWRCKRTRAHRLTPLLVTLGTRGPAPGRPGHGTPA